MFELEVNHKQYDLSCISNEIKSQFENNNSVISAFSLLLWAEHCTECAMPSCYKTCDLYVARKDGKCRRFENGISPIFGISNIQGYIVKIDFKKLGALQASGFLNFVSSASIKKFEKKIRIISKIASSVPDSNFSILGHRGISSKLVTKYKHYAANKLISWDKFDSQPDYFLLEIFNGNNETIDLTFVIRAQNGEKNPFPYQNRLKLEPGFHRLQIDFNEMKSNISIDEQHWVSITPNFANNVKKTLTVYFGLLGFVKDKTYVRKKKKLQLKTIKIVVWDLDNTIWDGILIEDDQKSLILKPKIRHIMETLDRRGIINSVISKNNHDEAMEQLTAFGLDSLIVFPKISWQPKSQSMNELIKDFNVGADTIAFIDDSIFEREEVQKSQPEIRVFDALDYEKILELPECNPKISSESSRRREFYQNQKQRIVHKETFSGDYLDFIKICDIKLDISKAATKNSTRIQELVQRTNQMNFSGNRYTRAEVENLIDDPLYDCYSLSCVDKFGDYGTVGFCVVKINTLKLVDLMFSCRIQSKRIEHAFLYWLIHQYSQGTDKKFIAEYLKTSKNSPAGRVFIDLGFTEVKKESNHITYEYDFKNSFEPDLLISVYFGGVKWEC